MSRLGKIPVIIPDKVKAQVENNRVIIEGPKGKLEKDFDKAVNITLDDGKIVVTPAGKSRHSRAMYGTARKIVSKLLRAIAKAWKFTASVSVRHSKARF